LGHPSDAPLPSNLIRTRLACQHRRREAQRMGWTWQYEGPDGQPVEPGEGAPEQPEFPTQADAESWVGEVWKELLEAGVHAVSLFEGDRKAYGPMGLDAA